MLLEGWPLTPSPTIDGRIELDVILPNGFRIAQGRKIPRNDSIGMRRGRPALLENPRIGRWISSVYFSCGPSVFEQTPGRMEKNRLLTVVEITRLLYIEKVEKGGR